MKALNIIAAALLVAVAPGAQTLGQGRSEIYERVVADGAPGPYNPQEPDGHDRTGA